MSDYDAIIIGAGLGGLACGAILARSGVKTLILEQSGNTGGCCSSIQHDGFTFDIGPSVVEFKWVWDILFEKLGRKTADYIDFIEIDPIYSFITSDGKRFSYPADLTKTRKTIETLSPDDVKGWDKFVRIGSGMSEIFFKSSMFTPMMTLRDMMIFGIKNPLLSLKLKYVFINFESALKGFFKSEAVRASMGMHAYYLGLPPALCPGYAVFLCYTDHEGVHYPKGGMGSIPKGIEKAYREEDGEIRFGERVIKIITDKNRAAGIRTASGKEITSRVVISNINAKTCYLDLIGRDYLPRWAVKAMESYEYSFANPNLMLGLKDQIGLDAHHTVCHSTIEDMNSAWFDYCLKGKIPSRGFLLLSCPTIEDHSLAPENHHCLNIVTVAPYRLSGGKDWDSIREEYIESRIDIVEKEFHLNLRENIVAAKLNTPKDFERMLLQPEGAIFGIQFDNASSMIFRPRIRSGAIKNLYLVGSSTHLGGGTPTTTASGILAADMILREVF